MSRRLNVRPATLLAALPLTTLACATPPPAVTTGVATVVAGAVVDLPTEPPEEVPADTGCDGAPELSCSMGNMKAPNYGDGRS